MTSMPRSRAGHIATFVLGALALGGAIAGSTVAVRSASPSSSPLLIPLAPAELASALTRAGLTPENLAAAGLSKAEAGAAFDAAEAYLDEHIETLRRADTDLAAAHAQHDPLLQLVQSGRGSSKDAATLGTARTSLTTAQAAVDAALNALFAAATDGIEGVDAGEVSTIRTAHANNGRGLPTRYLGQDRTGAQWLELRNALANARIAADRGEDSCPKGHQTCLDADAASSTAAAKLQANLAEVQGAWTTAIAP